MMRIMSKNNAELAINTPEVVQDGDSAFGSTRAPETTTTGDEPFTIQQGTARMLKRFFSANKPS